jgi:hypothetical protein
MGVGRSFWNRCFRGGQVLKFLMWLVLLVFCWPLALIAILLYPVVWLLLLPFRLLGIAVEGVLELVRAVVLLPARVLSFGRR